MAIKKIIKAGFSFTRWVGVDQIKKDSAVIGQLCSGLFKNKKAEVVKETFSECMQRLQMTEEDLKQRMRNSKKIVIFCLLGIALLIIYMLYLWANSMILAGLLCAMLSVVLSVYAFREHFNLFQMRQRRLGCTFQQWFQATFKRKS